MGASVFGGQDLAVKFGSTLCGLIVLTIILGLIKLALNKRKLEKNRKLEEAALANTESEKLNERELDEGDLFGVRAIERGYFGGVAQSRCNSPAQSMFGPTPSTSVLDLSAPDPNKVVPSRTPSPEAGTLNFPPTDRPSSDTTRTKPKHKPSPLNLSTESTTRTHQATASTSTLSVPSNRPSLSESLVIRPDSDLSISPISGDLQQNYLYVPAGSHATIHSLAGSVVNSAEPSPNSNTNPSLAKPPATYVPNTLPPRSSSPPRSHSPSIPVPPLPSPYFPDSTITIQGQEHQVQVYQTYIPSNPSHQHKPSATSVYSSISSSSSSNRKSIARTQDSVRHAQKKSSTSSIRDANEKERERDHLHYDPAARSPMTGKVQGRTVDFDHRRESPFGGPGADDLV